MVVGNSYWGTSITTFVNYLDNSRQKYYLLWDLYADNLQNLERILPHKTKVLNFIHLISQSLYGRLREQNLNVCSHRNNAFEDHENDS